MAFQKSYLFEYLGNIIQKKDHELYKKHIADVDFEASYSVFMVTTYLSMSPNENVRQLILDNQMLLEKMPQRVHYKFLLDNVQRCYSSFIRYIK